MCKCGMAHKHDTSCGHECYYAIGLCKLCYARARRKKVDWSATMRKYNLQGKYKLTQEDYIKLLNSQGGMCAICKTNDPSTHGGKKGKLFGIDHNHTTGKIRGLLCGYCNTGLGGFRDNVDLLQLAVEYLKRQDIKS